MITSRTAVVTAGALTAFAANSLLCRAALGEARIDATSFTLARVASGALVLCALAAPRGGPAGSWPSALALFAYAIAFSLAYLRIPASVGALLLFGAVQLTMLGHALATGGRLRPGEWAGVLLAFGGVVVLTRPGLAAPDPIGALLMAGAGIAWGVYTLRGRGSDPLRANAGNFARAAVPALATCLVALLASRPHWTASGMSLAVVSGAITSGVGYALWYSALRGLTATQASVVQLGVPVLAAAGAAILLREALTPRFALATILVLGGIALAVAVRRAT